MAQPTSTEVQIHMQTKQQEGWLLGDRGYRLQRYLMTPLNPDKVRQKKIIKGATQEQGTSLKDPLAF